MVTREFVSRTQKQVDKKKIYKKYSLLKNKESNDHVKASIYDFKAMTIKPPKVDKRQMGLIFFQTVFLQS